MLIYNSDVFDVDERVLFQVHSQIKPCGRVMCNCGVAAREGNDVIAFDGCGGGMQIVQKSTEPGFSDRVKVTRNGRSVKVHNVYSKDVALLSLIVIVLQSSSFDMCLVV